MCTRLTVGQHNLNKLTGSEVRSIFTERHLHPSLTPFIRSLDQPCAPHNSGRSSCQAQECPGPTASAVKLSSLAGGIKLLSRRQHPRRSPHCRSQKKPISRRKQQKRPASSKRGVLPAYMLLGRRNKMFIPSRCGLIAPLAGKRRARPRTVPKTLRPRAGSSGGLHGATSTNGPPPARARCLQMVWCVLLLVCCVCV